MKNNKTKKKKNASSILDLSARSLIIFFILISISFAATECGYFGTYLYNNVCVPDLLVNLSTILILIGIIIGSIFYGLGIAFEHTRIKEWSKEFLYQILGTAVILSVYLGLLASLNIFAPAIYNSNLAYPAESTVRSLSDTKWINVQSHSEKYVGCLLSYTKDATLEIVRISSSLSSLASTSIQLISGSFSNFYPLFPTGGGLTSIMSVLIGALATTIIQLKLQLEILKLNSALFSIVLPLGLILRSFPYTRGAGAAMIAITFGFTIFLPIFYLIIEDIGYHFYQKDVCSIHPPSIGFFEQVKIGIKIAKDEVLSTLQKYFGVGGDFESLTTVLLIQATILPFVAYLVVLNIIKRLAEVLGGEIDFSTLVRLI
ncbi:MAG: hypothetical protein QXO35_02600 [Candidatus Micrarchaeia archaeon]